MPRQERRFFSDVADRQTRHFESARNAALADALLKRRHDLAFLLVRHGAAVRVGRKGFVAVIAASARRPAAVGAEALATSALAVRAGLSNHDLHLTTATH